jgi:hypothetical protein
MYYTRQQPQERNLYGNINYKRSSLCSKEFFKYFKLTAVQKVEQESQLVTTTGDA